MLVCVCVCSACVCVCVCVLGVMLRLSDNVLKCSIYDILFRFASQNVEGLNKRVRANCYVSCSELSISQRFRCEKGLAVGVK